MQRAQAHLERTVGSSPSAIAREWVLTGSEDHLLVAAFPNSAQLPSRRRVIRQVRAVDRADGIVSVDGGLQAGPSRWRHFRQLVIFLSIDTSPANASLFPRDLGLGVLDMSALLFPAALPVH